MLRAARVAPDGRIYHVLNRAAPRFRMLRTEKDFLTFRRIFDDPDAGRLGRMGEPADDDP